MNRGVMVALLALVVIVGVFAYLNAADGDDRRASQREAEIYINMDEERAATVDLPLMLDLKQHEFTETLRSSEGAPRDHTYRGVRLMDLFRHFDLDLEDTEQIVTRAADGYTVALTVEEVREEDNVYVVHELDGEPLSPKEEGGSGPFMVVIRQDEFGQRWNKYLMEIDLR